MTIIDNALPEEIFKELQIYCNDNKFQIAKLGDKEFSILQTPLFALKHLLLSSLERIEYELILTFIRSAKNDFDTDLRIHADNIVDGQKTALASVLYINNEDEVSENGTMFWKHHTHGYQLEKDVSDEEFNRLITEDSNDITKWKPSDVVYARPNRLLIYDSNAFHSKWPAKIETGERKVLVCFYKEKQITNEPK